MSNPKIAIIGAGPAGLSLARLLQMNQIPCTIFDLDASRHVRNQGGTLDLHPKGGQKVLRAAGLMKEFQKYSRPEGEAMKLVKYDGSVLWDENELGNVRPIEYGNRPEIDREKLRDIFLDSVEPETIQWSKKLIEVKPSEANPAKFDLYFTDSVERGFDLVVGADGAWSKVRPLVTEEKPFYSGISAIELWSLNVSTRNEALSSFVGKGSMFMFDEGRALMCQRTGNDSIRTYASVRQPESWVDDCGIDFATNTIRDQARQQLIDRYFGDCGQDLKDAITSSTDELIPRKMWMLPVGIKWETRSGVALVGDAAHLMTPFAGVGVNLAMVDALELANSLVKRIRQIRTAQSREQALNAALHEYESDMFSRSEIFAAKTARNLKGHFSKDGVEERATMMHQELAKMQQWHYVAFSTVFQAVRRVWYAIHGDEQAWSVKTVA